VTAGDGNGLSCGTGPTVHQNALARACRQFMASGGSPG
jgi:hypothetical protein